MNKKADYGSAFKHLIGSSFIRYRGCLILKLGSIYQWSIKEFKSLDEAKAEIDRQLNNLKNTIK